MFSKKSHLDVKKSTVKIQDPKKDLTTRLKHLKIILDNVDVLEAKGIFEANFSHIYHILYDSFIEAENHLRQRVHKAHKEELENALWVLENVLSLLPELLHKRWQLHSLSRILGKLLHPGNSIRVRRQAVRYFLMWYQALGENAPEYIHKTYSSLVPNFGQEKQDVTAQIGSSIFHDTSAQNPVTSFELLPILPPSGAEKLPDQPSKLFLETLLEYMVTTVVKLEWHDKLSRQHRCFSFLLEQFKIYYLPKLCPNFCYGTSIYSPNLDLPVLRKPEADNEFVACRVSLIKWVANHMHQLKKPTDSSLPSLGNVSNSGTQVSIHQPAVAHEEPQHDSAHPSLDSTISVQTVRVANDEELASQIVRDILYSSRENVNFIHEIYRQAFLLNFNHAVAIRRTIAVYKDIIQLNLSELPPYALELPDEIPRVLEDSPCENSRPIRLRNDSYLGAIHKENLIIRAGLQNVLQVFVSHAANVFLSEVSPHFPSLLEEQTDACKRVLNIYRYMVMHTRMDSNTWEQLLLTLLQITSLVLSENPPKRKGQTLGVKLAPAIFQTLIVTWIKANLNVTISRELWDRFLHVLTSLTNWEELIKEWAKTLETLTRVLARHVYNLDLTDLPLDRLSEQKTKKTRRGTGRQEGSTPCSTAGIETATSRISNNDISIPDTRGGVQNTIRNGLSRSYSETNLAVKRRSPLKSQKPHRRSYSLDNLHPLDSESTDRTRSPSPAPSSGLESSSIKDSPIQLDVLAPENSAQEMMLGDQPKGVVCGGTIRGWLPNVAVILWKRMLGALGDINQIYEPRLHAQVFEYLIKLTETLIKIKQNQGVTMDNQSTPPPPELVPPLTLVIPWCFEALTLSNEYETGKLSALRLLCTVTLNCDPQHRNYLAQFYQSIHIALCGSSRSAMYIVIKYLGPRFLSLQLPGSSLLLLDLIHACNIILNSSDVSQSVPRTEAVSILANLLSLPNDIGQISVLKPEPSVQLMACPDLKERLITILLRSGRKEPTGIARCFALSALGIFIYKEFTNQSFHPKVVDALNVLLLALKINNKTIAQLASNILFLLCDYGPVLWTHYPHMGDRIIRTLCSVLFSHAPSGPTDKDCDKALCMNLLLCLGEWCMRLGPARLLEVPEYGEKRNICLLSLVFTVLYKIISGRILSESEAILKQWSMPIKEDFDSNIILDNLMDKTPGSSPSKNVNCQQAVILCAKAVAAHLVIHLGHFPMAIGAARLSSLVVEHDDVPSLVSDELSGDIFSAPNIQLFVLTKNVVASLVELPALEVPGGGATAGFSTADKQVRVLLRDLSGKSSWDASILYQSPDSRRTSVISTELAECDRQSSIESKWGPVSLFQPESFIFNNFQPHLPQRAVRHRPPNVLPDVSNAAPDLDQLDDLLQYLGYTSPECLENAEQKLNEPDLPPLSIDIEQEAIASVISQRNTEQDHFKSTQNFEIISGKRSSTCMAYEMLAAQTRMEVILRSADSPSSFQQCRLLFSQLGLATWERRKRLHLLNKTERLLREIRNLDTQRCRETHKIAVIYIAPGQEDKNSILSNQGGSVEYEQFLASLAWEVELEGHTGFLGGLQKQGSTGLTAPYYATSLLEAIFHVATRMPGETPEAVLNKTRHLGNDEVHIVWSEHSRDYRRDIIPTEFCDVLIVIYPLGNQLNRVTITCKAEVSYFGVLFNEAIVSSSVLAGLVRATVVFASRAKRTTLPFFQQYYEERARSLETVVTKHRNSTTYEDFISQIFNPTIALSPFRTTGRTISGSVNNSSCSSSQSTLAAALIDPHGQSHKGGHKNEHKFNRDSMKGVWFNNADVSQNVESTSISPRPLKKLSTSLKSVPRRPLKQDVSSDSPPESPTQLIQRK
ncbi:probable Rho GTPase-activating protein CG5521 isoform X2 [Agrilus planipennis]|uniref:Probable Rho GTPase-activating protein CG5521 isoform X2 n=1 Tax=Agrilus planipennis TaxID=224129 RepID=A0A1W4WKC0_AGRPL|nr:probable Rho GTPase-activating protein CG5521 isoform X2 [Agrilus planipennis]